MLDLNLKDLEGMCLAFKRCIDPSIEFYRAGSFQLTKKGLLALWIKQALGNTVYLAGHVTKVHLSGKLDAKASNNSIKKLEYRQSIYERCPTRKNRLSLVKLHWLIALNGLVKVEFDVYSKGEVSRWAIAKAYALNCQWLDRNYSEVIYSPALLTEKNDNIYKPLQQILSINSGGIRQNLDSTTLLELDRSVLDLASNFVKRATKLDWLEATDRPLAWNAAIRAAKDKKGEFDFSLMIKALALEVKNKLDEYDKSIHH